MDREASNKAGTAKKYDVAYSKKLGRYLVAAKNLSAGEIILREDALAVGPGIFDSVDVFCFACLRPLPGYLAAKNRRYACSKCNVAPLCDRLCETAAGLHTGRECELFREKEQLLRDELGQLVRILLHLRLWLMKDERPDLWDKFWKMEAHLDERRNTPIWQQREKKIVDVFRKFDLLGEESGETMQQLCGIVDVNAFELRSPGGQADLAAAPLLLGLFLEASLMAHACRGSAHVSCDPGFRMTIHAALPMRPGDLITFNYTSSLLGTIERQEHLQNGKYFRCGCSACRDPLEDGSYISCLLCPRCKKDYVAIQKPTEKEPYGRKAKWQCQKCKRIYKGCLVKSAIDISKRLISELDTTSHKAMESLLAKLSKTFHKNHFVMISLKQKILVAYRKEMVSVNPPRKVLHRMIELCEEVLGILEIVEPGLSTLKGMLLYEMHLPLAILANREYAASEISASELASRLEKSRDYLRRSLAMLLLEPAATPEGLLAKRALQEMRLINQNVEDARVLALSEGPEKKQLVRPGQRQGRHKNSKVR